MQYDFLPETAKSHFAGSIKTGVLLRLLITVILRRTLTFRKLRHRPIVRRRLLISRLTILLSLVRLLVILVVLKGLPVILSAVSLLIIRLIILIITAVIHGLIRLNRRHLSKMRVISRIEKLSFVLDAIGGILIQFEITSFTKLSG